MIKGKFNAIPSAVYLGWVRRFLKYVSQTGQNAPTPENVKTFLSYLAVQRKVASSTQNQAFNALLFLCRNVLMVELGDLDTAVRARRGRRLPVVLTPEETRAVLEELQGLHRLMLELMYGSGLRVSELVKLRVKDIDFDAGTIMVRASKGDKDRITFLPRRLVPELRTHLAKVKDMHERDLATGAGEAPLPNALKRKYRNAGREEELGGMLANRGPLYLAASLVALGRVDEAKERLRDIYGRVVTNGQCRAYFAQCREFDAIRDDPDSVSLVAEWEGVEQVWEG